MNTTELFLKYALDEAKKAERKKEVPVGAVVVIKGKIIARGHNLREKAQSVLAHAELIAIQKASRKLNSWRLEDCELYVTLEPCPMCAAALQQARVKTVYYGASDPKGGAISLGLSYKFELFKYPECSLILKNFFSELRKNKSS